MPEIGRFASLAKAGAGSESNARWRAGRSALAGIALLLLGAVLAVWLWSRTGPERRGSSAVLPAPARASAPDELEAVAERETARSEPPDQRTDLGPFSAGQPASEEERFRGGPGSLRGHVESSSEEPFPLSWKLVIGPSITLPGRERAVSRTLEITDGRQEFSVSDLPLGGYDVRAEAEGFNGLTQPVLLERGSEHPFVELRLVPAGFLEGRILESGGAPAPAVPVTLIAQPDGEARETRTDGNGLFRFELVPDGPHELLIGRLSSPILPERRPLRFSAPSMTLPDLELPLLGRFDLRVIDSLERPVENVRVRGSGTNGGLIDETTDHDGRISARYLPAGHYRIRLEHPQLGSRRVAIELEAGEVEQDSLRLGS